MCLWHVQHCVECDTFTPDPNKHAIACLKERCLRKSVDRFNLSDAEKFLLGDDYICKPGCLFEHCGLLIRQYYCGQDGALREYCPNTDPSASESEDDDWSHPKVRIGQSEEEGQSVNA